MKHVGSPESMTGKQQVPGWLRTALRVVGVLVVALSVSGPAVSAENLGPGGGTRVIVSDEVIGSYRVLLLSAPDPAVVGPTTFVVRMSDPATGENLKDSVVTVALTHATSGKTVSGVATHAAAGNAIDYATHLQISEDGQWNGLLRIDGAGGVVERAFLLRVAPPRSAMTALAIGLPFLVILAGLGGVWLLRSRREAS